MVQLTRLNNQSVMVNSDLIKFVEQSPDTLITLVNGEKFMVRENAEEIVKRIIEYRRLVLQGVPPVWQHVELQPLATNVGTGTQSKG
jgi:flagellar protein FlbD